MAISRKVTDKINNAEFEQNINLTPAEMAVLAEYPKPGSYSNVTLEDVINNFIVSHVGPDKVLTKVPRHEVAFWAQRGMQEFSYDILVSEKNIEFELGESLSFPLPADYVNYVKIVWVDAFGNDRTIHPDRRSTPKQGLLQDDQFNQIYDYTGERTKANKSDTTERFQNEQIRNEAADRIRQDSYGFLSDDIYDYYYSGYFGRRYGNDPQYENYNGWFQLDLAAGIIYFNSSFQAGDLIGLRYISDGIGQNGDLTNVYLPKLAEDAIYAWILYHLTKVRTASAQLAPLYMKEMRAKMRNAKLRLSQYKTEEITQVLRGRAKWIKH